MSYFILAIMVIVALLVISQAQQHGASGTLTTTLQFVGGIVVSGLALLLAFTGRLYVAIPLGAMGLALLLKGGPGGGFMKRTSGTGSQHSTVRTGWLEVSLNHETGDMDGRVLFGTFEGRTLDSLSEVEAVRYRIEVDDDPQSVQLVEAFMDRKFAGWRDRHAEGAGAKSFDSPMTRDKALEVLGLRAGASAKEIRTAHRELMKKFHPDQGGSTWMATQINAAKDLLLG